jgi:hypothetical protein
MKYFRIQTNRNSIKKLLSTFQSNIEYDEYLISPRPLPKEIFTLYTALVCVSPSGKNVQMIQKFKNHKEITVIDYEREKNLIKFFWSIQKKNPSNS